MWDNDVEFSDPFETFVFRVHPRKWSNQNLCTTMTVWGYDMNDARELGMRSHEIYDSQLKVSKSLSGYTASDARLDSPNAWCANTSLGIPAFQIDLLVETSLMGILIQGKDSDQSTASIHPTSFNVRSSPDAKHWWYRKVSNFQLKNGESFRHNINKPINGSKIRFNYFIWEDDLCFRFELLGVMHISNLLFADFEDTVPLWQDESSSNGSWAWFRIGDIWDNDDIADEFNSSFIFYNWNEGASKCLSIIQSLYPETTPTYSELNTEGVSTAPPTSPQPASSNSFYPCMDGNSQSPYVSRILFIKFQEDPFEFVVRLRYLVRGLSSDTRLEVKAINADEVETTVWEKKAEIEGRVQRGHFVYTIQTGTQIESPSDLNSLICSSPITLILN
ncbi:uncharacterized protein [Asterias amurensis]|uniref:uncharacterized protein n=1 Tax=Asterias amurensis TaxID=7602 RepID=UPI003AB5106E